MNSKTAKLIFSFSALVFIILLLFNYPNNKIKDEPPLSIPFSVWKASSKVNVSFCIKKQDFYEVGIEYSYDEKNNLDRDYVYKTIGPLIDSKGRSIDVVSPLELNIKLMKKNENGFVEFYARNIGNPKLSSWGFNHKDAQLIVIDLAVGCYSVLVESLKNFPELESINTNLYIVKAYRGK